MRRLAAILAVVALLAAACGERVTDEGFLLELLSDLETEPHEFEYREEANGRRIVVEGRIEDDFRRYAKVSLDGRDVLEQVVSDDAMAVRAIDPERIGDLVGDLDDIPDFEAARTLRAGRWVIDHAGAPALFPPTTREGSIAVGLGPLLDSAYVLSYLRRAIQEGAEVEEHNPDAPEYQPADDPFAEITERELSRGDGFRRFDVLAPALPSPAQRGTEAAVPIPPQFRKLAFYVRGDRIAKVLEEVSFERREFRRAREGRESDFYLRLQESVRAGQISEPVRLRTLEYNVFQLGRRIDVEVPLEEAMAVSLDGFLEAMDDQPRAPAQAPVLPDGMPLPAEPGAPQDDEPGPPQDDEPAEPAEPGEPPPDEPAGTEPADEA